MPQPLTRKAMRYSSIRLSLNCLVSKSTTFVGITEQWESARLEIPVHGSQMPAQRHALDAP